MTPATDFPALPLPFPTRKAKCGDCLEGARIRFLIKICVYIATFAFAFGRENGGNFPHNKSSCSIHSDRVKWQLRQWMVEHRKTTSNSFFFGWKNVRKFMETPFTRSKHSYWNFVRRLLASLMIACVTVAMWTLTTFSHCPLPIKHNRTWSPIWDKMQRGLNINLSEKTRERGKQ